MKRRNSNSSESSENEEEFDSEIIEVDFEFKFPEELDFHGLKTLLNQIFSSDVDKISNSLIADNIINNPLSCVIKTEGNTDPYAVMTIFSNDDDKAEVKQIFELLKAKSEDEQFLKIFNKKVAFVMNDRLINMPPQLMPPMFKMLLEEIKAKNMKFDYFLFLSKIYKEMESKTKKKPKRPVSDEIFYYQAEDEFIEAEACIALDYELANQQSSDSRRVFGDVGTVQSRRILVVEGEKIKKLQLSLETNVV